MGSPATSTRKRGESRAWAELQNGNCERRVNDRENKLSTRCPQPGGLSGEEALDVGRGDAELLERLVQALLRDGDQCGHAPRETEEVEEADAAAVARRERHGVEIQDHGDAGAFLPQQKKVRLVVFPVALGRVDESHG